MCMHGTAQPVQRMTFIGFPWLYMRKEQEIRTIAAEDLVFHSITSGASNDIEQATKIARSMITRLGMSETFGMTALETVNNKYLGGDTSLACSDQTATRVDEEVVRLIQQAYEEARRILEENKEKLHELAKFLYERETITGEQFMEIVNRVPQLETAQNL